MIIGRSYYDCIIKLGFGWIDRKIDRWRLPELLEGYHIGGDGCIPKYWTTTLSHRSFYIGILNLLHFADGPQIIYNKIEI